MDSRFRGNDDIDLIRRFPGIRGSG